MNHPVLEAAEKWLENPTEENAVVAANAANTAFAVYATNFSYGIYDGDMKVAYAVYTVRNAANAASNDVWNAVHAASNAAWTVNHIATATDKWQRETLQKIIVNC